jgi:hypothetical protein
MLMRSWWTAFFSAALLAGCASVGERPEERGLSLLRVDGRAALPGISGTVRAALGMGVDATGCLYREWGEGRVDGRVVLVAGECKAEVE